MVRELHFLPRSSVLDLRDRALALIESSSAQRDAPGSIRVVEMVVPSKDAMVADMAMDELGLPEALSAMHIAKEIHVHGLSLELALHMLPFVRPEVVKDTTLVIHGPWPETERELTPDATRFQVWPGPVCYDEAAQKMEPRIAGAQVAQRYWVDPCAATFLPRACGPIPIRIPSQEPGQESGKEPRHDAKDSQVDKDLDLTVLIMLGSGLPQNFRSLLSQMISDLDDGLCYEVIDEVDHEPKDRARMRRVAQLAIFGNRSEQGFFEAALQKIPIVVLEQESDMGQDQGPPGVRIIREKDPIPAVQQCRDFLVQCAEHWRLVNPAPIDTEVLHQWVCARSYQG